MSDALLIEATLDPCKQHKYLGNKDLLEWCGFIPQWLVESVMDNEDPFSPDIGQAVEKGVLERYRFPVTDSLLLEPEAKVLDTGEYLYPEDPPLYPMVTFKHIAVTVHVYPYGMVAFVYGGNTKMYRLD